MIPCNISSHHFTVLLILFLAFYSLPNTPCSLMTNIRLVLSFLPLSLECISLWNKTQGCFGCWCVSGVPAGLGCRRALHKCKRRQHPLPDRPRWPDNHSTRPSFRWWTHAASSRWLTAWYGHMSDRTHTHIHRKRFCQQVCINAVYIS